MAIYRNIRLSFWTDSKVVDDFTPEDRYFYLYLMTNPHTNLAGCYELSLKQASDETGYTRDVISNLLERFEAVHDVIRYSKDTKEVLLLHWSKFNWTRSKDFQKPLLKEIELVKNLEFRRFLQDMVDGVGTVSTPSRDGVGTTDTVTDTVSDTDTVKTKQLKQEFENLWSIYPKKQGKDKACSYYVKARKNGTTYEDVYTGIEAYKHFIQANETDMQYVKMGSTFFSQKAWQDEYPIKEKHGHSNTNSESDADRYFTTDFRRSE